VNTVTQPQRTRSPYLRRWAAVGLGAAAIAVSVLLIATDGITGSSRWAHHPGISAAPLLLIAAAIAAGTIVRPRPQRPLLIPAIAALAFTSWGLAQLLPDSAAAGYLSDTAIVLFVIDAAYAITVNTRAPRPPSRGLADAQVAQPGPWQLSTQPHSDRHGQAD
jgi:hypothetical protein